MGEGEYIPFFKAFPGSHPRLFLYLIVQNLAAVVSENCSLCLAQLKVRSPVSKEEEGAAVFVTAAFGARQSKRFLKITTLTPFLNLVWFLPQGEQTRTWNSRMENASSEVMVERPPVTLLTYILAVQVSVLNHLFFEHFIFCESSSTRCSYYQES